MVAVEAEDQQVVIYRSPNLVDWSQASRFGPAHAAAGAWESPDLFPLPVYGTDQSRWVLLVNLNPGAVAGGSGCQYFVGDFDGVTFTRIGWAPRPWTAGSAWTTRSCAAMTGSTTDGTVTRWSPSPTLPTGGGSCSAG